MKHHVLLGKVTVIMIQNVKVPSSVAVTTVQQEYLTWTAVQVMK